MVTIAIAGGTRGIGRTIAETIKGQGKHEVKIFSRAVSVSYETPWTDL